jgi:membrane protein DedA with SNARE-associated domain
MVLASLSGSVTHTVALHGVYAVFALMAIDAVFPAASELVMLCAGAIAAGAFSSRTVVLGVAVHSGPLLFVTLASAGTLGYLAGALVGWWIGKRGGRRLIRRHGSLLHLDQARMARAERWFDRWGVIGVLVGRVTPLVRSFVSVPAGVFEVRLAPYALWTLVGSAVWAFGFAAVGWALGARYRGFDHVFHYVEYGLLAFIAVAVAVLVWRTVAASLRSS